jgi:hypothetical protein
LNVKTSLDGVFRHRAGLPRSQNVVRPEVTKKILLQGHCAFSDVSASFDTANRFLARGRVAAARGDSRSSGRSNCLSKDSRFELFRVLSRPQTGENPFYQIFIDSNSER